MAGVNKVILVGNVGKDPEVKNLDGGTKVANFSLATSESYKDKSGNKVDKTEWHNIVVWRGLAEVAEKYIRKGSQIYLEGKITTRSWGEEGNKKYMTEIVAENVTLLGKKSEGYSGDNSEQGNHQQSNNNNNNNGSFSNTGGDDSDLPF